MKILHVVTYVDKERTYGGPVSVAMNLAEEQVRQGHEVTVLSLAPSDSEVKNMRSLSGVDRVAFTANYLPFMKSFSSMYNIASIFWLFRKGRDFSFVHFHFSRDLFQGISALIIGLLRVPFFLQTHGMLTNPEAKLKSIQSIFDSIFVRPSMKKAKQVLALQFVELRALKSEFGISNVSILPNGVSMRQVPMQVDSGETLVVFVSRLHTQKNPHIFLKCAKRMIENGFNGKFVIAGPDGGLASQVVDFVSALNNPKLQYLGPLSHSAAMSLLKKSSVLVLPSKSEAFPMVVLEALSVGTPVAVSKSCHIADLIVRGDLGVVFDETPERLEAAVLALLSKQKSRKTIIESSTQVFGISGIVEQLSGIYNA